MTQVPFQAHDSQVGMQFNPTPQTDFVSAVEESNQEVLADLQKRNNDLFTYENAAAQDRENLLRNLVPYSRTLRQVLDPVIQRREHRKKVESANKQNAYLEANPGILQPHFRQQTANAIVQDGNLSQVESSVANKEIDHELATRLVVNPTDLDEMGKRGLLAKQAANYPSTFMQGAMFKFDIKRDDGTTEKLSLMDKGLSTSEVNQIIYKINSAVRAPFADLDPALVYQYLGKDMERVEKEFLLKRSGEKEEEFKVASNNIRINNLRDSLKTINWNEDELDFVSNPAEGYRTLLREVYMPRFEAYGDQGPQLARQALANDTAILLKTYDYQDVDAVREALETELEWKGDKPKSIYEKFSKDGSFDTLKSIIENEDKERINTARLRLENRTNEAEAGLYKLSEEKAKAGEEPISDSDIRATIALIRQENPSAKIPTGISNFITREQSIDAADQDILKGIIADKGIITGYDTLRMSDNTRAWAKTNYPNRYRPEDGGTLEQQAAPLLDTLAKNVDTIVDQSFNNLAGDLKDTLEISDAKRLAKAAAPGIFWDLYLDPTNGITTLDQAFRGARKAIETEILKGFEGGKEGKPGLFTEKPLTSSELTRANNLRKLDTIELATKQPGYYKTNLLPGTNPQNQNLETPQARLNSDIGILKRIQLGENLTIPWVYHQYAKHAGVKLDLDAWDVANAQLKLWEIQSGQEPVGLPERSAIKTLLEGLTSPEELKYKRLLKTRTSWGRTRRAVLMQEGVDFNDPNLVRDGVY